MPTNKPRVTIRLNFYILVIHPPQKKFRKNLLHPIDIYLISGYNIATIKKGERKNENHT